MANLRTEHVRTGIYNDYERSIFTRRQLTTTIFAATVYTNFLGVWIPIAATRCVAIYTRLRDRRTAGSISLPANSGTGQGHPHSNLPLAREERRRRTLFQRFVVALRNDSEHVATDIIVYLLWCVFCIGIITSGVATALLATSNKVVSNSPNCGIYLPEVNMSDPSSIAPPLSFASSMALASSSWARNCYVTKDGTDGCVFFTTRALSYRVTEEGCSFHKDLCHDPRMGIRFSTGPLKANLLGINTLRPFEFRRETSCAPLNMNSTFVKRTDTEHGPVHRYYYGPTIVFGNATYETNSTNPWNTPASYSVLALNSGVDSVWQANPGLLIAEDTTTTIMIIDSRSLLYLQPSEDPIFPATTKYVGPRGGISWINGAGYATAFACSDRTSWRAPGALSRWHDSSEFLLPEDPKARAGYMLLWTSLVHSHIYSVVKYQQGAALDAQSRIMGTFSLPIDQEQWKTEASFLFNTSLAQLQIRTKAIARGDYAAFPGFVRQPNHEAICNQSYVFIGQGYQNVSIDLYLALLITGFVAMVASCPALGDDERFWFEPIAEWLKNTRADKMFLTGLNLAWRGLVNVAIAFRNGISRTFEVLSEFADNSPVGECMETFWAWITFSRRRIRIGRP